MGIANYVIRRGRYYAWRRIYRGSAVQVPLATTDPVQAKRLSGVASAVANHGWNLLDRGKADLLSVRDAITSAIRQERALMECEAIGKMPAETPGGRTFFFFFNHGDAEDDEPKPRKKQSEPSNSGPTTAKIEPPPARPAPPRRKPARTATGFSSRISDIVARVTVTHERSGRANAKTLTQMRAVVDLFCEITGVDDIRDLHQRHLAYFVATLDKLPPAYRRSVKERDKPISEIIAEAEASGASVGLSVATINRNIVHLGKVVKAARAEGITVDATVNPSLLRRYLKRTAKDEREAFTPADVIRIFSAPAWQGCKSVKRRREPGEVIVKDWLYWVPLLAVYSGARREEICGLETADVSAVDGIPVLHIRPNARRGLKNPQSERIVPVHPHLVELGFLDFADKQREAGHTDLFNDLRRKSSASQIGDSMDYLWRNIQSDRLGPQPKKTFHSFRHYAIQGLRAESDVEKHVRAELFGHLTGDIEDDRYGGRAPISSLRVAVEALPRVF